MKGRNSEKDAAPIPDIGSQFSGTRHVCVSFNSNDEGYREFISFSKDGFEYGEETVHIINPDQKSEACVNRLAGLKKVYSFVWSGPAQAQEVMTAIASELLGSAAPNDNPVQKGCPMALNNDVVDVMRRSPPDRRRGLGSDRVACSSVSATRIQAVGR